MSRFRSIAVFENSMLFERYKDGRLISRKYYYPCRPYWRMQLEGIVLKGQFLHDWHVRPWQGGSLGWVVEVRDE